MELTGGVAFFWAFLRQYVKYRDMLGPLGSSSCLLVDINGLVTQSLKMLPIISRTRLGKGVLVMFIEES